jgi:hypothetical protein
LQELDEDDMLDKAEAAWSPKKPNGHWLPQMQVGLKEVAAIGKIVTRSMRAAFCTLVRDSPFYAALRQEDTSDKDVMSGGELGFQPLGVDDGFADLRTIALWSEKRCTQLAARVFSANLTKHFTVHARNIPRGTPSTTMGSGWARNKDSFKNVRWQFLFLTAAIQIRAGGLAG